MQRGEYLRLRAEQQDLALGVERWDTRSLPELKSIRATRASQLLREEALLAGSHTTQAHVDRSRRLLTYLRALCYLRELGIAADWPRGSVPLVLGAEIKSSG